MAKVNRLYKGFTSNYSSDVEVAESVQGVWFVREKFTNKWGPQWTKWRQVDKPKMPTKIRCRVEMANVPDFVEVNEGDYIEWGFNDFKIRENGHEYGYRLPNV